ncbi:MAG: putative ABC transporter ATP-binding protein [Candidatus Methanolliviera sp. GoM_asphalt]|nr:MAG: putative ABC transporter ATP-binding protein [Candidatus Methanolliviera sp. GoM_asphalt]
MVAEIRKITIIGGTTKSGEKEAIERLEIYKGDIITLVGTTGSGKSQLLSDIEQLATADTPSNRAVILNDGELNRWGRQMVAQLSQAMNFVLDMPVEDFLELHASSRGTSNNPVIEEVIGLTNSLSGEPIDARDHITSLSGGQSRALMIADIAVISDAPVVLIDEIENAGINRLMALEILSAKGKIVIVASHDPLIILMGQKRIVMHNGGMFKVFETSKEEKNLLKKLIAMDDELSVLRDRLRMGDFARSGGTLLMNKSGSTEEKRGESSNLEIIGGKKKDE